MSDVTNNITIQEVFGDDVMSKVRAIADYAFGATPFTPESSVERERRIASILKYSGTSRFFVALTGEQPQATATAIHMTENVRGKILSMSGVGGVASLPTGRRQGHVRTLFVRLFEEMRNDGHIVSTLYPFRESFYERLGYASFPAPRFLSFDPANLGALVKLNKAGSVEQAPFSEAWDIWREYLESFQVGAHGFSLRDRSYDVRNKDDNTHWVAIARDEAGTVIGVLSFKITGYTKRLESSGFYYTNALGKYLLLDWVGRHVDQVSEASIRVAPDDYAETWFRDLKAKVSTVDENAWPGPSGRIIAVEGLTGIGAGDGEIAIQLVDDYAPWNNGVFTLSGASGTLTVTPGGEPTATVTIQGLSALVFSGHDPADFIFRGWGDADLESQATLRSLFPKIAPILHEEF